MDKCKHHWCVVHAVYGDDSGGTFVRRWCHKCKVEQVGVVTRWRAPKPDEFDIAAEDAGDKISRLGQRIAERGS